MDLTQLKKRKLDKLLVVIYSIKTEVKVEYDGRVCSKQLYTLIGINILGKRVYLSHGINYREDTEFWFQKFKDIKNRGVERVLYFVATDYIQIKRALEINFNNIKIVESPFELIDKIMLYFSDNYNNVLPRDIRELYVLSTKEAYTKELLFFNEKYGDNEMVKILLNEKLNNVVKYYEIPYNIRQLLFAFYFIRDNKIRLKREFNKIGLITDLGSFYKIILTQLIKQERTMYFTKEQWLLVISELIRETDIKEYL